MYAFKIEKTVFSNVLPTKFCHNPRNSNGTRKIVVHIKIKYIGLERDHLFKVVVEVKLFGRKSIFLREK